MAETNLVIRSEVLPATTKQELVEVPVAEGTAPANSEPPFRPAAIVRVGNMEQSLTNGVSPKLIKHLKELLSYAE